MSDLLKLGDDLETRTRKINETLASLNETVMRAENSFTDGEIITADGNERNAKSSGKKIVTLDINADLDNYIVSASKVTQIPSLYSVEYALREVLPVLFPVISFRKGKELYSEGHADYNKLILVANVEGKNMVAADTSIAKVISKTLDRGYRISNVTRGLYNPLITEVEYSSSKDSNGLTTHTIKLAVDAERQDSLSDPNDRTGGFIWLSRQLPYMSQPYYIDPETL